MRSNRLSKRIAIILFIFISFSVMYYSKNKINISLKSNNELTDDKSDYLFRKLLSEDLLKENKTHSYESENCTKPSIENFPKISTNIRKSVFFSIICLLLIIYVFIGIAIICDKYFVPSLQLICDKLKLESDVAGSTFMAAGSSAPELATSVIGVFVSEDDIGIGAVVGSAVFNIAFVIGLCALFAGTVVSINWWPITRDSFFYLISICVLFIAMFDERISVVESLVFLLIYFIYILFMAYNKEIEKKVLEKLNGYLRPSTDESSLVTYNHISETGHSVESGRSSTSSSDVESKPIKVNFDSKKNINEHLTISLHKVEHFQPSGQMSRKEKVWNILIYPLKGIYLLTIPDCSVEGKQKWFIITFSMSCVWISILSYFMVWFITIIGFNLRIPDTVMGLDFIAAGASIPDAIASLIVVREGLGDMALTNAIASNVFDILVCLGLPWFIKTAIINPGSSVGVISRGLEYSTLSLLSTVVFFLVITHYNGWKLDRRYGAILMIWYFAFMVMATLYELNIFGQLNPPMCSTHF